MGNHVKYLNKPYPVKHVMDSKLYKELFRKFNKLYPREDKSGVTLTDIINAMITHCIKESDISKIVIEYKNK